MAPTVTEYHAAHFTPHPARTAVWRAVAGYVERWMPGDGAVLEIGAGYCDWINQVRAERRVAVDRWPGMPAHAAPGVEALVLDLAALGDTFGTGAFDAVLASNVLEHFTPDAADALVSAIAGVLRPRGRLFVIQPNFRLAWRRYFDDYTHRAIFTDASLAALLRANGLRVLRVEPRFLPYSMRGARVPIADWLVAAYLRLPFRPGAGQMLVVAERP